MNSRVFFILLCGALAMLAAEPPISPKAAPPVVSNWPGVYRQAEIPVWPGVAPGSEGKTAPQVIQGSSVSSVHQPTLTPYLPAKEKATGAAVIVIPGGGHRVLAIEHEGHAVAKWLSEHGLAAFVLKYRLAREKESTYTIDDHAVPDTQRAIRLVRSRAAEWGVDPAKIGVMGFSAGGELAAFSAMRFETAPQLVKDAIDGLSAKPAFQALIYPGTSRLIQPVKDAPPLFLACGYNDRQDIAEGLAELYLRFKKAGIPTELHIYSNAGHGFGYRESNKSASGAWLDRFEDWLKDRGFAARK
ncbi:MAG: alpha/beta hydrolase [Verrucomicrobiota bacterium]